MVASQSYRQCASTRTQPGPAMLVNYRSLAAALAYALLLTWIFIVDITVHWAYMGFVGFFSWGGLVMVLVGTIVLALITRGEDTRGYILLSLMYILFIPSLIFIAFGLNTTTHFVAFWLMIAIVYAASAVRLPPLDIANAAPRTLLYTVVFLIVAGVAIQAWYGGLRYFNLDLDRVYEFREAAASELPPLFGYLYSNISSVLVPVALLFAVRFRSLGVAVIVLISAIILFGMTQHKIVLFGPFAILFLYYFYRKKPREWVIGLALFTLPLLSAVEILIDRFIYGSNSFAYYTALFVRRLLFFPPVLDGTYIQYFEVNAKYFWSASQIGALFSSNRYGVTPPYLIGYEYFADADTSANTGVIGSGYANAGLFGVALYSVITGLMIAYLNAYGRRIDHGLVTAVSLLTIFNIFTSTDLLTAFLTHGALLLLVVLAFFPPQTHRLPAPGKLALT